MDWIATVTTMLCTIVSHIVVAQYFRKRKYNEWVTACCWGVFAIVSVCIMLLVQNPLYSFLGLLTAHLITFCITTDAIFSEKAFLFLTYANSFSICIGIKQILDVFLPQGAFRLVCTVLVVVSMHFYIYNVLILRYRKAKKFFTAGWWKLDLLLFLFLIQFLNQYAFQIVDRPSAKSYLLDFILFSFIFNGTLVFIFDSVKNIANVNQKTYENDRLKNMAYKDALTNMPNRLAYVSFIQGKQENHKANDPDSFVFVMLDVDNFKHINDTKGHSGGDEVLQQVSAAIKAHFENRKCYSFRVGGDEFVLLLENMHISEAEAHMKAINSVLLRSHMVTLSYGCCMVDFQEKDPFESAYKRADILMYEDKQRKKTTV